MKNGDRVINREIVYASTGRHLRPGAEGMILAQTKEGHLVEFRGERGKSSLACWAVIPEIRLEIKKQKGKYGK